MVQWLAYQLVALVIECSIPRPRDFLLPFLPNELDRLNW